MERTLIFSFASKMIEKTTFFFFFFNRYLWNLREKDEIRTIKLKIEI
jgi:hypothetical protein